MEDSLTEEKAAAEAARVAAEVQAARDEGKRAVEALRTQLLTAQARAGLFPFRVGRSLLRL